MIDYYVQENTIFGQRTMLSELIHEWRQWWMLLDLGSYCHFVTWTSIVT